MQYVSRNPDASFPISSPRRCAYSLRRERINNLEMGRDTFNRLPQASQIGQQHNLLETF